MLDLDWAPLVGRAGRDHEEGLGRVPERRCATHCASRGARRPGDDITARNRIENDEVVEAMKKRGLVVQPLTPELRAQLARASSSRSIPSCAALDVPPRSSTRCMRSARGVRKRRSRRSDERTTALDRRASRAAERASARGSSRCVHVENGAAGARAGRHRRCSRSPRVVLRGDGRRRHLGRERDRAAPDAGRRHARRRDRGARGPHAVALDRRRVPARAARATRRTCFTPRAARPRSRRGWRRGRGSSSRASARPARSWPTASRSGSCSCVLPLGFALVAAAPARGRVEHAGGRARSRSRSLAAVAGAGRARARSIPRDLVTAGADPARPRRRCSARRSS